MAKPNKSSPKLPNRKAKRRIILAVVGILIVALTYVCRDILAGELKDEADSLHAAQSKAETQSDRSLLSTQFLVLQQQLAALTAKANIPPASKDYSAIILQDTALARQTRSTLDADFDGLSKLVDKLSWADVNGNLRELRDQVRAQVVKTDKDVDEALTPSSDNDLPRALRVKVAVLEPLATEISVVVFEGATMKAADHVQDGLEKIRIFLVRLSYVFYAIGIGLAVYAAVSGGKEGHSG